MKWLQWMSRMFFITVLATVISMVTTWVMVDMYAEQVLRKFHLDDLRGNVQLFDVIAQLTSQSDHQNRKPAESDEKNDTPSYEVDRSGIPDDEDSSDRTGTDTIPNDAVAVWGQASSLNEIVISADAFNQAKDEMSAEDKIKIFSILSSHMTDELMMQLSVMMEGGLTRGELTELENMMAEMLDQEQYDELMTIFSPYLEE